MLDGFNRTINYLRVSVTDRCNLRCRYCMPPSGVKNLKHSEVLTLEEIARLVNVSSQIGIRKVRFTGGEPLVRKNFPYLISLIKKIGVIDDIAITTNGILFTDMAEDLKEAGIQRVNISLDTLNPEKYRYITRGGSLSKALGAIQVAQELNLYPIKLNVVIIRGFNDEELLDFAELAVNNPLHIRFIEFMPIGDLLFFKKERMMTSDEMKKVIARKYSLLPGKHLKGNGPAKYYSIGESEGSIGFINPMSHQFCNECNRIRMTAEGKLRACLYDKKEVDLLTPLRDGASDAEIKKLFIRVINSKPIRHNMDTGWGEDNQRKMYQIGG
ncbi:MAG: GTP 3',8-cyclase MoaA [Syntrophomonadaceae bacterium]|jgi:cyclic pyranopterin phosphate synthase